MNLRLMALALLLTFPAMAQKVNLELSGAPFKTLINQLENQTSYRYYYKVAETDTLTVNYSAQNVEFTEALRTILSPKGFRFAIDPRKMVYITKNDFILTDFSTPATAANVQIKDFVEETPSDISIENWSLRLDGKNLHRSVPKP